VPDGSLFDFNFDSDSENGGDDYAYDDDSDVADDNGSDVEDDNGSDDGDDGAQDAIETTKNEFEDSEPSPVVHCQPAKKDAKAKKVCPAETIKKNLDSCDGGTGAWDSAKKVAGKDPTVKVGKTQSKMDAETSGSEITIAPTSNCCDATESLLFELHNVESKPRFDKIEADAAKGSYSREDYTKAEEEVEYDGLKRSWESFDKCKKSWGCGAGAKSFADGFKKAKNFDDYYNHYLSKGHKDVYRGYWDSSYKAPYEAKTKAKK